MVRKLCKHQNNDKDGQVEEVPQEMMINAEDIGVEGGS